MLPVAGSTIYPYILTTMPTRRLLGTYALCCIAASAMAFQPPVSPFQRSDAIASRKPAEGPQETVAESKESTRVARTHSATRRDRLGSLGGVLGGFAMATLLPGTGPRPAFASRKSPKEVQFELFKMGLDLTHAYRFAEAEKVYSEIISRASDLYSLSDREKHLVARAYSNRGNVRSMLDRIEEALVDYSKAVELSPDTSEFWLNRGLAYESIADTLFVAKPADATQFYDAAVGDYDHAIVLDPNNHRLYINAGDVLTHLQRHNEALENYRRALDLFPISPASRGKVALMEVQVGNVEKATYLLETIVRRNPDYSEMLLASAAIGWNVGRFAEGMDLFNMAVEKDPRLLDEKYLKMSLHWPPTMVGMVQRLREAGTMAGPRARAVKWFDEGNLI